MSPRRVVRAFTLSGAFLLLGQAAFSQATAPAPTRPSTGSTGNAPPGIGTTTLPSNTTNNGTGINTNGANKLPPAYTPPIYLTGRVMLDTGSPPPEPVTIERLCNGHSRAEGYTDSRGNFGIQLGNESGVFQDASEEPSRNGIPTMTPTTGSTSISGANGSRTGSGLDGSYAKYQGCEIRAKLAGYRSQTINLTNRRSLDDPNIGTILLHKEGEDAGTLVSASSLAAPKDAKKAYERGLQAVKKNKTDDAIKEFQKAVELYPSHAEAWYELGRLQTVRSDADTARQSFQASIKADPKFINPYVQLSILSLEAKNWQELKELTDRAMRLDSFEYPQVFLFNAVANYNLHRFETAETSLKQAVRLDTQHRFPDIQHLMGLLLLLHKDYAAAGEQFREFLKAAPESPETANVRKQLAEIDRMNTQTAANGPKDK